MARSITTTLPHELTNLINIRYNFGRAIRDMWFYLDSYIGGTAYQDRGDYIPRMPHNEDTEQYAYRRRFTQYDNHCRRVVNNYVSQLFSKPISRNNLDFEVSVVDFKDWNNRVIEPDQWFRYLTTMLLVLGEVYYVIDQPNVVVEENEEYVVSNADRMSAGLKYYVSIVLPMHIPAVEFDSSGEIDRILIESNNSYYYWTNSTLQKWDRDKHGKINYTYPVAYHDYKIVPARRIAIDLNQDGYGESLISDIAGLNNTIYNIDSITVSDLFLNAQNIMLVPIDEDLANNYPKWGLVKDGKLDLKGKAYIPIAKEGKPEYLTKDLSYHDRLSNIRATMVDAINEAGNVSLQRMTEQSGIAKSYDSDNRNQSLETLSYLIEGEEYIFWNMFFQLSGSVRSIDDVELTYKHKFDVIDKIRRQTSLIELREIFFNNEPVRKVIDKILAIDGLQTDLSDTEMNMVLESIESTEEEVPIDEGLGDNTEEPLDREDYIKLAVGQ